MKKAIRFFAKIGNSIFMRVRSFAWQKFITWCALFLGICILLGASALAISGAVKHKTVSRITTVEALGNAGEHFDVILVLGCAVHSDGTPSKMLEDRIQTGVAAYQKGLGDVILMSGDRHEGYDEVTAMERVAKELGVPILCCSQLARSTEARGKSHKPQLADLRDSGSIEQDADIVKFIYRDVYYSAESDNPEDINQNAAECIIAKNRHGQVGTAKLHFDPDFTRFTTPDNYHED